MNVAGQRILVVDDNAGSCKVLRLCLEERGFVVDTTQSGEDAVRLACGGEFALLLLDIVMPGVDGWEVLRRVRQARSPTQLPIIMATGQEGGDDVARALREGANDYVTKPIDLTVVAARIETQLSLKAAVDGMIALQDRLERHNRLLIDANQKMKKDLAAAARVQRALLPGALEFPNASFASFFQPCDELGGDILNFFPFCSHFVGFYVLDVSGHGVPAALLSVTLSRLLSPLSEQASLVQRITPSGAIEPVPPAELAEELNRRFAMSMDSEQFFTILYAVLDLRTCTLRYVSAGHPGPALVRRGDATDLTHSCLPIGLDATPSYQEQRLVLRPGDRLYLFSDGISEARNAQNEQFGSDGVLKALREGASHGLQESLDVLVRSSARWADRAFDDDVSALALQITATDA